MDIVVGYINSPEGEAAVDQGIHEAKLRGAKMVVVHSMVGGGREDTEDYVRSAEAMEKVHARLHAEGIEHCTHEYVRGQQPSEDIMEAVNSHDAELIVIGVHSAKFESEGETNNIRQIVQRYEVEHPVINDKDFIVWRTYSRYGVNAWPTFVIIDPRGNILAVVAGAVAFIGGVLVHEVLHGIAWRLAGAAPGSVRLGFQVQTLTPYAHSSAPMTARAYRIGAATPGVLLGIVPAVVGLVLGAGAVFWFGLLFTLAAGGDTLILWLLRGVPGSRLVEDHPSKPGCLVLPKSDSAPERAEADVV